jgi:hypothetical protein
VLLEVAMSRNFWLALAAALTLLVSPVAGEERLDSVSRCERSDEQIAALIEQLDHFAFASRQAASEQLEEFGVAALAQLEATATAGSREASSRALAIIKRHFQAGSDEVKLEARGALQRLAESRDASASQRARDVLNPPQPVVASNRFGPRPPLPAPPAFPPPLNNIFGGAFGAGGFRRVSVSEIGGRKTVEIDERERRVKIETLPGGNIEVEVEDKQNAGNPVRKLAAKDLDDLRRKDGEIARLYEQHQGPAIRVGGGPVPFGMPPPGLNPADIARLQIQSVDTMLERYRQRLPTDPAAQRMIDSLEQTKARLKALAPHKGPSSLVR